MAENAGMQRAISQSLATKFLFFSFLITWIWIKGIQRLDEHFKVVELSYWSHGESRWSIVHSNAPWSPRLKAHLMPWSIDRGPLTFSFDS
jgi:hypothetical protein